MRTLGRADCSTSQIIGVRALHIQLLSVRSMENVLEKGYQSWKSVKIPFCEDYQTLQTLTQGRSKVRIIGGASANGP